MEEEDDKHIPHVHSHDEDDDDTLGDGHMHILGSQFKGEKSVTIGEYQVPINPMDEFDCDSCQ